MSDRELVLYLDGDRVGVVLERRGRLRFIYDDEVTTPLSTAMPVALREHAHGRIHPWLWGLLPEVPEVRQRWATQFGVSADDVVGLLASEIGLDCPGAVQCLPAGTDLPTSGDITEVSTTDLAAALRALRQDPSAWLGPNDDGRFSLAGAQAKTALLSRDGVWYRPRGVPATTHILKPAIMGFDGHAINEHLCLKAARSLGLSAAATSVQQFEDESAIVVTRYDRRADGPGDLRRVHQEDLCQALGVPPTQKYQNDGGPSVVDIVAHLRAVQPRAVAAVSIERFADALLYNWLIVGTAAHAKNYSLLLAGPQVRLAPLYDIASILPYDLRFDLARSKLAMKFGGTYRTRHIAADHVVRFAKDLGVSKESVVSRGRAIAQGATVAFADAAADAEVRALDHELPARLVDAIAGRVDVVLRTLDHVGF